jgi:hypothetical protein
MSSTHPFVFEQSMTLRRAVDLVLTEIDDTDGVARRQKIAAVVIRLADESAERLRKVAEFRDGFESELARLREKGRVIVFQVF